MEMLCTVDAESFNASLSTCHCHCLFFNSLSTPRCAKLIRVTVKQVESLTHDTETKTPIGSQVTHYVKQCLSAYQSRASI